VRCAFVGRAIHQKRRAVHAWFQPSWIVRIARPVEALNAQIQAALASADPKLPFSGFYD
jgi:hypothetical protein